MHGIETESLGERLTMGALSALQGIASHYAQVLPDVACLKIVIANAYLIGNPRDHAEWVLVDAGLPGTVGTILKEAEDHFGKDNPPQAIILTHGHFDHVGALVELVEHWEVPVYAHEQELPYLTGKANYPPAETEVSKGLMAKLSPAYPREGINLGGYVQPLPSDGEVPSLPEWKWIATPGHTPGHISLFRESDRALIAGDAFVTVKQESATEVLLQDKEVHGSPAYFTPDWKTAWESVKRLDELRPELAMTGHGKPMQGEELRKQLSTLTANYGKLAVPDKGKYVQ